MSINGQGTVEDADMTDDGEKVVTMMDVLQEQQEFEEDANAVLGASDDKNCTYSKGYIKRQAIYACLTCCPEAKTDPLKRAGVCLACCLSCHENHDLVELYTKRNFRCDCGNPKFNSHPCQFTPNKTDLNEENVYDQNFSGFYCVCHRPYPDPEAKEEDEMIQCIICEDWLHATHLEATVPPHDQYAEMVCKSCMEKNEFLYDYSVFAVNAEAGDVDIITVNGVDAGDKICNGDLEKNPTDGHVKETKPEDVDMLVENGDKSEQTDQSPESKNKDESKIEGDEKNTHKELVADTHENKESESTDKPSENEESKTTENPSEVPMETESEHAESVSKPVIDSSEIISEIDFKDEKTITESAKDESISTMADAEKPESITDPEKPESIAEAVADIAKPESITESEKTETRSKDLEMTESEKENALLQDESTDKVQSKVSENIKESDNTKNNETDNSDMETVTNDTNKDEKEQSERSPVPAKSNDGTDIDNITEVKSQEGLEVLDKVSTITTESTHSSDKKLVEISETDKAGDEISIDSSSEPIEKGNVISTSEPIPPTEDKHSTLEISSLEEKPSNLESKDSTVNNVSSLKDNINLPKLEDTDKVGGQAISKDIESTDTMKDTTVSKNKADVEMSDENKIAGDTIENQCNSEKKTNDSEVSDDSAKNIIDSEAPPSDTTIPSENKRKHPTDTPDDTSAKKAKLNESENITELETKQCVRPRGVKKIHKGATFWPQCFRQKLCTCNECLTMYKDLAVLFLLDPEDTVTAYETLGKEKTDGGPTTQYEKGLQALSSLDRIQQINALTEYNKMRDKLLDFLKSFKDRKEIVKEEDIKAFFAGMKPKREPDGVYFCR